MKRIKILKYITGTIVIIAICIVLISRLFPVINIDTKVEIDIPVQKVFMSFLDTQKMKKWMTGLEKVEFMGGMMLAKGAKFRLIFSNNGKQSIAIQEIKKIEWNKLIEFNITRDGLTMHSIVKFVPDGSSTIVITENKAQGTDFFSKTLLPFKKHAIIKEAQKVQEQFKETIEKDFH